MVDGYASVAQHLHQRDAAHQTNAIAGAKGMDSASFVMQIFTSRCHPQDQKARIIVSWHCYQPLVCCDSWFAAAVDVLPLRQ